MIPIREHNTICQGFVDSIAELSTYKLVATDKHAVTRLSGTKGNVLVAVIPSARRSGKPGTSIDDNTALFYVVTKYTPSKNRPKELDAYEETQQIIETIRDQIIDKQSSGCSTFFRLQPQSINIEPEYNTFGGYLGWSMMLTF